MFGGGFRENAARALLIPRPRPDQRTPLWQQRLKAQGLLQVARRYGQFPVVLETYRECLQDVFDLPALKRLLRGLRTRELDVVDVETPTASPYAASLLFDYVANYMYEDDTPPAERRAPAPSRDRAPLRGVVRPEEAPRLLDRDALEEVERDLQRAPRTPDELHDQLRLRGDLRAGEYDEALARPLLDERRAVQVRVAGEERLIAAEHAEKLVRGELRPGGTEREWCEPDVLRRLRRASLAALRKEVEPAEQAALGRFLPHWHGIDRRATLREALVPLQGLALPVSLWEAEVLPRRVPGYNAGQLDQLCASGEVVWVGAGLDRVAIFFREDAPALGRPGGATPAREGEAHDRIRAALGRSAEFWFDLVAATELAPAEALPALWDLVWAGEVTNHARRPLR